MCLFRVELVVVRREVIVVVQWSLGLPCDSAPVPTGTYVQRGVGSLSPVDAGCGSK